MLIIIAGATANGKSDVSFHLARRLDTEIISADSMQVYKYFDIGTAKPSVETRKAIPHHFVDTVNPDEEFNASHFCSQATEVINSLQKKGKVPLVTGGTGLYIKALTDGYSCGVEPDKGVRAEIEKEFQHKGNKGMYARLLEVDPAYAEKIHVHDTLRITRALEVFYISGKPFSHYVRQQETKPDGVRYFVLERDRKELYKRIEDRVDTMFASGLVDEVEGILSMGYHKELKPFLSIGYRQVVQYLNGEIDYHKCVDDVKKETRHYAKRQCTWFNGIPYVEKIYIGKGDTVEDIVARIKGNL